MNYVIFSFEEGDFIRNREEKVLVFESKGAAIRYLKENFYRPPVQKTKEFSNPRYYAAPFKISRCA
ncbi:MULTISPECIES: hypothetical protein [unclassified Streptococcus]|uniref:hypothetical protein n=1 Tax=unclassified Streptococcus TaxID=2608887 RepID=UPI00211B5721|nr:MULTISPECIES: hypothetical protein [unclassified Streptococcus]MCQ9212381.1 hypothetical protein [Streptococcus sp. B01]MCQ9213720.1 hypothetical protein [Streptococcus sp. O1]MCQ9214518.1 hypothetical protein [Streptococcus sp. O1]